MGAVRTLVVCSLVWVSTSCAVHAEEARTWVDTHGNQVPGELVDVTTDQMVVLRVEGAEVSIPLDVFSEDDRAYLRQQMPEKVKEVQETKEPPEANSSAKSTAKEQPKQKLTGADLYQPPRKNQTLQYYCTGCYGDLSSSIGVGDHCPRCGIMIQYEEDENGNVIKGSKPPWFAYLPVRTIGFLIVMVLSTAWKFRRLIPMG
ncbi:hypothetical protein Pan97_30760 [Bremerella volcania]|uniref:SLA1 homology domain-containing protein n=1 Tax=Bremerella volcania TaxID=2527984 RepID=A0A518C9Y6_9BACT|nr:hypothetical protein [Bremerella volcania]QDU76031.1 hypothetical protein Pan97_30760 [Bremerella volcania]